MSDAILKQNNSHSVNILVRIVGVILFLSGLPLLAGGIYLITLGGSWYYAVAGAGICAAAFMLWKGLRKGIWIYLGIFALTVLMIVSKFFST